MVPRIHGADYFKALADAVGSLERGCHLWVADWRGDQDQFLTDGLTLGELLTDACQRGVQVRGLTRRRVRKAPRRSPMIFGSPSGANTSATSRSGKAISIQ